METKFKSSLMEDMKKREISDSSIKTYIRNLEKLNDDLPLNNLLFLKDVDAINKKLEKYKPNTIRSYLISINSALETVKDKKSYKKLYETYYKMMNDKAKEIREDNDGLMNEKQKSEWISWDKVLEHYKKLGDKVKEFEGNKVISESQYNILLNYVILALYCENPPRRNVDYQKMDIVKSYSEALPKDRNYLDYDGKKMIFNVYKTAKKHGVEQYDINDNLKKVIDIYMKFHPSIKGKKLAKTSNYPFLVYYNGKGLDAVNSITRILNSVFGAKIGASALRHIYVSEKFGDTVKNMEETAEKMGHTVGTMMSDYIKKDINKLDKK
jgi:integrase